MDSIKPAQFNSIPNVFNDNTIVRKSKFVIIFVIILSLVLFILGGYFLKNKKRAEHLTNFEQITPFPTDSASSLKPSITGVPPAQAETNCKQAGESICINPLICPNDNNKCCKGLFAIIESKSNVICQVPSDLNLNKPRLANLEELQNNNFPKYGHCADFSWVSGKLTYNSLEGGCWTLHFEEDKPTQTEEYNGVFALRATNNLKTQFKDNGFVVVYGEIIGQEFSMACPPNIYEVTSISPN